jgi:8-oxo-dGTP pyrophosphatase MutT (NUDIX family)
MRVRQSARLLLVNPANELLLFKYEDAVALDSLKPAMRVYWATVGGGVEPGETFEATARRELWEETGITACELGPWVATREREFVLRGERMLSYERYVVCRVAHQVISLAHFEAAEWDIYRDHRWWSLGAMRAVQGESFAPPWLPTILERISAGALPAEPEVFAE